MTAQTVTAVPQQSTRSFVAPTGVPIKKTVPISDLLEKEIKGGSETIAPPVETAKEEQAVPLATAEPQITEGGDSDTEEKEICCPPNIEDPKEEKENLTFAEHWKIIFAQVFEKIPLILHPLDGYIPEIKDNIITVKLKNDFQKDYFGPEIRHLLSYLRNQYDDQIEDIQLVVDESVETKKIIYDLVDKMDDLKKENPEFENFISILKLHAND